VGTCRRFLLIQLRLLDGAPRFPLSHFHLSPTSHRTGTVCLTDLDLLLKLA
jgi:hypothetical protein